MSALLNALENGEVARSLASSIRSQTETPHGRSRRLTNDEIAELVRKYQRGETVRSLSGSLGLARGTVAGHLAAAGVVMRTEVQDDEHPRMIELFDQGRSLNDIGRETGRDPKTVKSVLRQAGLVRASPRA